MSKKHWYTVKLTYIKDAQELFSCHYEVGMIYQAEILDHRPIKKLYHDDFVLGKTTRHLLCCGTINLLAVAYLGHFRKVPSKADRLSTALGTVIGLARLITNCKR